MHQSFVSPALPGPGIAGLKYLGLTCDVSGDVPGF